MATPEIMAQLMDDIALIQRDYAKELDMANGKIGRLFGFTLIERDTVAVYNNASTPVVKAVGASSASTDNDLILCWQKRSVASAIGDVDVFSDEKNPLYLGGLTNILQFAGGRKRRQDGKGVLAIVQGVPA